MADLEGEQIYKERFDSMDSVSRRDSLGCISSTLSTQGKRNYELINWGDKDCSTIKKKDKKT